MAKNNVGIIKNLFHLHGTIRTSADVISCNNVSYEFINLTSKQKQINHLEWLN